MLAIHRGNTCRAMPPFRRALALAFLPLLSSTAQPLPQDDQKVEPRPRSVEDVKTPWTAPVKLDAPPPAASRAPDSEPRENALPPALQGFRVPSLAERVLYSEPGNGSLWAHGGHAYIASFDEEGATFLPRFGSRAPRVYPLRFTLESVQVGEQELAFERGVSHQRDDSVVSYERGSLVELYELGAHSMEQMFRFEQLPLAGELVLRVGIDTELELSADTPQGLEFSNEHGLVRYSRAVAIDARGVREELATCCADGVIEIRVSESFLAGAELPLIIDPLLSVFPVSALDTYDALLPDVAYNETYDRYLVAWQENWAQFYHVGFSMLVSSSGELVWDSEQFIGAYDWRDVSVASNQAADQFLIVAKTSLTGMSPFAIRGLTRPADNGAPGNLFQISGAFPGDKVNPDVGGDPLTTGPTYYCVVWERIAGPGDRDIHYQLVRSDSTLLNPTSQVLDNASGTLDRNPSISKSDGQRPFASQAWNVVWQRQFSPTDEDIRGAQIRWDGSVVTPSFEVDSSSANDQHPVASSLLNGGAEPRPFLAVYERGGSPDRDIQARAFRGDVPLTDSTNLSLFEEVFADQDQMQPSVDSDGDTFVVAHAESNFGSTTNYNIYLSAYVLAIGTGELIPTESHTGIALSSFGEFQPRITSKQSGTDGTPSQPRRFFVTWRKWYTAEPDGDIIAALYDSVFPTGIPYCFGYIHGTPCPCGNPGNPTQGCMNSTGAGGALEGFGSNEIGVGDMGLRASHTLPGQPGMFFQGQSALRGGDGVTFGDGLRCAGVNLVRLQVVVPNAGGVAETTIDVGAIGGVSPGDTRYYQFWYRDPVGGPCGTGFNLTPGLEVSWTE